ncbi:Inner membrane protein YihY formerly thought to be RNase [Furfurilactobacillus rossiae]|uniref:YihY/virulence factor BrkB family protein n=1 Tax=Furfurilactobacillus rossiae TaxID=231049 RepID=UPI0015BE3BC7|nr:YihY/virulence factor BrkB family protein [Furfurilactobacillus rossiae]MCF6165348.1 YihY/virulence factor BrkB family protein [Furfurilactobacillus rossiae]QLE63708.1 Inner membrane protein YihY formerly thought to be RNase [Furfurilactobacillus rossiae]
MKRFFKIFLRRFGNAEVSNSAVILAWYSLLSIFPAVIVIGNLLPIFGINARTVLDYLQTAVPADVYRTLAPAILSFLQRGSGSLLSIGAVVALWSTSQVVAAFQRTVNQAYGVGENQNAIANRLFSFMWMILVIVIMAIIILFFTLGQVVVKQLTPLLHLSHNITSVVSSLKWPVTLSLLFVLLLLLYYFLPNVRLKWRYVWVGALLSTVAWLSLSQLFSLYVDYFAKSVTTYKTVGSVIVIMMWLNFSGIVILTGSVLNASIQEFFSGEIIESRQSLHWITKIWRKTSKRSDDE